MLSGGAGSDALSGGEGDDRLMGGDGNDQLSGDAGNDDLIGGDGSDMLSGGSGDDLLSGGGGSDIIDGGEGTDIAVFDKPLAAYDIELTAGGSLIVTDLETGQADTLTNVEYLRFGDGALVNAAGVSADGNQNANGLAAPLPSGEDEEEDETSPTGGITRIGASGLAISDAAAIGIAAVLQTQESSAEDLSGLLGVEMGGGGDSGDAAAMLSGGALEGDGSSDGGDGAVSASGAVPVSGGTDGAEAVALDAGEAAAAAMEQAVLSDGYTAPPQMLWDAQAFLQGFDLADVQQVLDAWNAAQGADAGGEEVTGQADASDTAQQSADADGTGDTAGDASSPSTSGFDGGGSSDDELIAAFGGGGAAGGNGGGDGGGTPAAPFVPSNVFSGAASAAHVSAFTGEMTQLGRFDGALSTQALFAGGDASALTQGVGDWLGAVSRLTDISGLMDPAWVLADENDPFGGVSAPASPPSGTPDPVDTDAIAAAFSTAAWGQAVPNLPASTAWTMVRQWKVRVQYTPPDGHDGGGRSPIVLDLDGDGVELVSSGTSASSFAVDASGTIRRWGWVGADDGLLAYDHDHDGIIDRLDEISFVGYDAAATTDLEGLRLAFDTNHDGVFDALDDKWSDFVVWQDADGDGVSDAGELKTLDEIGITGIGVLSDWQGQTVSGNEIHGFADFTWGDGSTGAVADVSFAVAGTSYVRDVDTESWRILNADGFLARVFDGASDATLDLAAGYINSALGGSGDDIFTTSGNWAVSLYGNDGDDTLVGAGGDDWLVGGAGSDTILAGGGNDTIFIDAEDLPGNIDAGAGEDTIVVSGTTGVTIDLALMNAEIAFGRDGNDILYSTGGTSVTLSGGAGNDILLGGSGNDVLIGGEGADRLDGGAGDDVLFVDSGDLLSELRGGSGNDLLYISGTEGVSLDLTMAGIEAVIASDGNDTLTGVGMAVALALDGQGGNDTLVGGDADDALYGGSGDDVLSGGAGADILSGGAGEDTASYASANSGVTVDLADASANTGDASGDTYDSIENLWGSAFDDMLTGGDGDNIIEGGAGGDMIDGGAGNDTVSFAHASLGVHVSLADTSANTGDAAGDLYAGIESIRGSAYADVLSGDGGDNVLEGGGGSDALSGGGGIDIASYEHASGGVTARLGSNGSGQSGDAAGDTFNGIEGLKGSGFDDTLFGDSGGNVLDGGVGSDRLYGGLGNDTYFFELGDGVTGIYDDYHYVTSSTQSRTLYLGRFHHSGEDEYDYDLYEEDRRTVYSLNQSDAGASDAIRFGEGITLSMLAFQMSGNDLLIGIRTDAEADADFSMLSDKICIKDYANAMNRVEYLQFHDGTTVATETAIAPPSGFAAMSDGQDDHDAVATMSAMQDAETAAVADQAGQADVGQATDNPQSDQEQGYVQSGLIQIAASDDQAAPEVGSETVTTETHEYNQALNLVGTDGDDDLSSDGLDSLIAGGTGDDTLTGGAGSDFYLFNAGDGHDTIVESGGDPQSDRDVLLLGGGISPEDIWFERSLDDLRISVLGSDDTVTVRDWFADPSSQLDAIQTSDGHVLDNAEIGQLVDAMSSYSAPDADGTEGLDMPSEVHAMIADMWELEQTA